jgi:hypothetical protein
VTRLLHHSCALAVAVVCFSTVASADLKIKTRTTVMGHTSESTVYIKGARERTETSFGGHGGAVSIIQCDQKRMITISGDQCMVMPMGGGEGSCPATPNMGAMAREMAGGESTPTPKGGVVTITRTSNDTGERQNMFGYKARHIKTSMMMESSPDACNQSHMKMEMDGWYADLSAGFSCADESYRALACGGTGKRGCSDRIVMKGGGGGALGYPLKLTTTIASEQGTFTTTTEVVELTNTSLDAPLFDMPPGCKVMDMSAMMGGAPATTHSETAPETATAPTKPAAASPAPPPAPVSGPPRPEVGDGAVQVAVKAAGVVRIGVVKIKDMSGQSLPTDSLRLNLMSEIARHQHEAIPLFAEAPHSNVESEARSKQCDYILYTVPTQVKEPNSGGLPPASLPKGVVLDPAKFEALTDVTLYKVGKPLPELKEVPLAADASQFAVDAVMTTFVMESDRVDQQIAEDAHPKPASKSSKAPPKKGTSSTKPN